MLDFGQVRVALQTAIESYLGKSLTVIEVVADPKVEGTYGARTLQGDGTLVDFLVTGMFDLDSDRWFEALEEVEFADWLPKSQDHPTSWLLCRVAGTKE